MPTPQEIEEAISDEGYSADKHKGKLKEILTTLQSDSTRLPEDEKAELVRRVKAAIRDLQAGKPISEDTL